MLTRMLSLGNIMIVSSAVRRGPYWHLLEACLYSTHYSSHIEAILTGVSQRLGMASLSVLFEAYNSQLAYSIRQTEADFFRFPPHLLGYGDRKQCAEATFRAFTPTYILASGEKLFESHCRVLQKSLADGLRDCFGDIVGVQITTWMNENQEGSVELDNLLKERLAPVTDFDLVLQQNIDSVVATILRALGDQDYSENGPIMEALRKCDETGEFALTFGALTRYRKFDPLVIHKPNLPAFSTQNILQSWSWFSSQLPDATTKATTYHVLHQLFADLQNTPLVNEQNRLINSISVWMAIRHKDFNDITLLHTVTHGALLFFAQTDLARAAQSILEWAFRRYRKTRTKDARMPNILIRLSCIAHDYSNSQVQSTSKMGNEMLEWIDEQVYLLAKVSTDIGELIYRALLAWPHQPTKQILEAYNDITRESLASVLSDHRITSNKFRLVRRLRDRALAKDYSEMHYSKTDFWRLKECMPSAEDLQDEDVEAFSALLTLNHGKIGSFNIEQPNMYALRPRHRQNAKRKGLVDGTIAARDAITLTLLGMLEDDSPSHVSNAYNTLRLIMTVSTAQDLQALMPSDHYRVELDYLRVYWRSPNSRPSRNLAHELKSDLGFDNFPRWISKITVLLADLLATIDPFFAQLNSILVSDLAFAEQVLPVLVHTLLRAEKASAITGLSFRPLLSDFFTSVLSAKYPDISCVHAVVDIVLHLRNFPPGTKDALGCNKWLDIDYTLLAQSAVLCGAYTTALLFLELASESNAQSAIQDSSTEQVLYEIYAHIDEPDGFYGIKSNDLQQFLVRRFHHEKQWEKAFRFHGAALEAGGERNGEGEGLLKAFHSFGFDHLAIDTLQNSRGNPSRALSASMSYRLGWRTETWDLPDRVENAGGVPLYKSLRAIYRERDSRVLDGIIRASLFAEMAHMRSLGSENLAEIREAAQDLMCLNQISQWRQDFIQKRLETKSFDLSDWDGFVNIGSEFKCVVQVIFYGFSADLDQLS
jgi:ataxia telangiectasia mutated family protein